MISHREKSIARFKKRLDKTAEIYRKLTTQNPAGGFSEVWTKVAEIPCRFSTVNRMQDVVTNKDKQQFVVTHVVFCLTDFPILDDDRFYCQDTLFEVHHVADPSMNSHHYEIDVERLDIKLAAMLR